MVSSFLPTSTPLRDFPQLTTMKIHLFQRLSSNNASRPSMNQNGSDTVQQISSTMHLSSALSLIGVINTRLHLKQSLCNLAIEMHSSSSLNQIYGPYLKHKKVLNSIMKKSLKNTRVGVTVKNQKTTRQAKLKN